MPSNECQRPVRKRSLLGCFGLDTTNTLIMWFTRMLELLLIQKQTARLGYNYVPPQTNSNILPLYRALPYALMGRSFRMPVALSFGVCKIRMANPLCIIGILDQTRFAYFRISSCGGTQCLESALLQSPFRPSCWTRDEIMFSRRTHISISVKSFEVRLGMKLSTGPSHVLLTLHLSCYLFVIREAVYGVVWRNKNIPDSRSGTSCWRSSCRHMKLENLSMIWR